MSETVSWHKVGQVCVCIADQWTLDSGQPSKHPIVMGAICTIWHIKIDNDRVLFSFAEMPKDQFYTAWSFRPIYPFAIEQLRKLDVPAPEQVKELA